MKTLPDKIRDEANKAAEVLKNGGLILYPTDTIWGIGCDATNAEAVRKVYQLKQRKETKSLIILLENTRQLNQYVQNIPSQAYNLIKETKKPLTIIYQGAQNIASNLINKDTSIAIRITKNTLSKQILKKLGNPIVSTSANVSGRPYPCRFIEICSSILKGVDYIVNLRQNDFLGNTPSTIINLEENNNFNYIRK